MKFNFLNIESLRYKSAINTLLAWQKEGNDGPLLVAKKSAWQIYKLKMPDKRLVDNEYVRCNGSLLPDGDSSPPNEIYSYGALFALYLGHMQSNKTRKHNLPSSLTCIEFGQ